MVHTTRWTLWLLGIVFALEAAVFNVEVITDLNEINALHLQGDTLYLATSGGFVTWNTKTHQYSVYTVADGLASQLFTSLAVHSSGTFILGASDGSLNFIQPTRQHLYSELSVKGKPISSIALAGDTLWVLRKDFLAVYVYDSVSQTFKYRDFFGNFGYSTIELQDVAVTRGRIWLATSVGLLSAPSDFIRYNLRDANNWQTAGLSIGINRVAVTDTALALITTEGFYWYNFQRFAPANTGLYASDVRHLQQILVTPSYLWVASRGRIYRWQNQRFVSIRNVGTTITSFTVAANGDIYAGKLHEGLVLPDKRLFHFSGPFNNYIGEVLVDQRGWVWCTAGMYKDQQRSGVSVLTDNGWHNFFYYGNLIWSSASTSNSIFEDAGGNVWVGTWGGGLQIYSPDLTVTAINAETTTGNLWHISPDGSDTLTIASPPELRHRFTGVISNPNYVVITGMTYDRHRNGIWIINNEARNDRPLVFFQGDAYDPAAFADDSRWYAFGQPYGGLHKNKLFRIIEDIFGFLWVATERVGIIQIAVSESGTLQYDQWDETNDYLKSNNTLAIAADDDGYVWLGTKNGLNIYTNGLLYDMRGDYHPIGLVINDIYVDARNNKWFATDQGISFLRGSGSPFEGKNWFHIVPQTSEKVGTNIFYANLPSPQIHSIFLNEQTGDLYAGTDAGLVIIHDNPFSGGFENYSNVKAGPNPFVISESSNNQFTIFNLVNGSEVRILSPSGRLVRILSPANFNEVSGAQAAWDGRDAHGNLVASGVYVYFVTNENGESTAGKVLVIRQ